MGKRGHQIVGGGGEEVPSCPCLERVCHLEGGGRGFFRPPPCSLDIVLALAIPRPLPCLHRSAVPRSRFAKELKRHHTRHHLKDDACWLAFTMPQIDYLLGTVPGERSPKLAESPATSPKAKPGPGFSDGNRARLHRSK